MPSTEVNRSSLRTFFAFSILLSAVAIAQAVIYIVEAVESPCPPMSSIFYSFMGSQILTLTVPLSTLIYIKMQKKFYIPFALATLAIIAKIAVMLAVFLLTQEHVGYCYMPADVRVSIFLANLAEAMCLTIATLMIRKFHRTVRVVLVKKQANSERRQLNLY